MNSLGEADVRAMVRLLGEVAALEGGHSVKKRYLLDGLCEFIGADGWIWALIGRKTAVPVCICFERGGFDDGKLSSPAPASRDRFLRGLPEETDAGPLLRCVRPLDAASESGIALYRRKRQPDFTDREARIADIVLTEIPWLHEQGWPEDRGASEPKFSPRLRATLDLLLLGRSRKEIADDMDISINTVAGYVKDLYKHFGVQSHSELMRRFLHGADEEE